MHTILRKFVGYSMTTFAQNTWMHSYNHGTLQLQSDEPMNEHTIFHAGTISKFIAAITAMKLVSKGVLTLDESIDTLPVKGVTLRQLLAHFSGFTDNEPLQSFASPGDTFLFAEVNYRILEQLIEYKTARHYIDIVREEIFEPLNMTNSFFETPPLLNVATGYTKQLTATMPEMYSAAADGLWTSTYDLAKLTAAIVQNLHSDTVLDIPYALIQQMFTPQFGYDWLGLGLFFEQGEASIISTSEGYRALLSIHPTKQSGLIAFTNCELPMIQFHELIAHIHTS